MNPQSTIFKKSGGRCSVSAVVSAPSIRFQGRGGSPSGPKIQAPRAVNPKSIIQNPSSSDYAASIVAEEECPADTDLRSIMDHLDEWLPVHEAARLRLFPKDPGDLGLLNDDNENKALAGYFKAKAQIK